MFRFPSALVGGSILDNSSEPTKQITLWIIFPQLKLLSSAPVERNWNVKIGCRSWVCRWLQFTSAADETKPHKGSENFILIYLSKRRCHCWGARGSDRDMPQYVGSEFKAEDSKTKAQYHSKVDTNRRRPLTNTKTFNLNEINFHS